jgi:hypothetical protein
MDEQQTALLLIIFCYTLFIFMVMYFCIKRNTNKLEKKIDNYILILDKELNEIKKEINNIKTLKQEKVFNINLC